MTKHSELKAQYVNNLQAVYRQATSEDKRAGVFWYRRARTAVQRIASDYGLDTDTVARVVAVLSPINKWERNIKDARMMVRAYVNGDNFDSVRVATFHTNKAKAAAILNGCPEALKGRKVTEFYRAIMGDTDAVTIDGHMMNAMRGTYVGMASQTISPTEFRAMQAAIRHAARRRQYAGQRLSPAELQAIVWVVQRRIKN